jgi:hypothetical protein
MKNLTLSFRTEVILKYSVGLGSKAAHNTLSGHCLKGRLLVEQSVEFV